MIKLLTTVLFGLVLASSAIYVLQPVKAASPMPTEVNFPASARAWSQPLWPAPTAPFDETPITPFETVGASLLES